MRPPDAGEEGQLAAALCDHAPRGSGMEAHLDAAIKQAVESPGSLQRARLVGAAARAHGLADGAATQLACAVEYFHVASLLLDDLPCMDNATLRRGQPCVHRVHGEATAILAALALINRAHALVAVAYAAHPAAVRVQAALCLDDTLGITGLVGGQARDLRFGETETGSREIGRIAAAKTGALFKLALVLPVLVAGPGVKEFRLLKALALYWGQWFQACDDMKDVLATPADAGKDTGRDRALLRPNLVVAMGPSAVRRRLQRLEGQIARTGHRLKQCGEQWAYLERFHVGLTGKGRVRAA
jgi:geranylgeranyl diphosphate synthase type II